MKHFFVFGGEQYEQLSRFFFGEKPHRNMLCQIRTSGFSVFLGGGGLTPKTAQRISLKKGVGNWESGEGFLCPETAEGNKKIYPPKWFHKGDIEATNEVLVQVEPRRTQQGYLVQDTSRDPRDEGLEIFHQ